MAFLDNSGDIILDAVLTETGRRRMAEGNFSISKFALGDDEIDYSLYDKNHPSGSAYYDLTVLQTPVFEAFTQINAGINYGLIATLPDDLLYMPVLKHNALSLGLGNVNTVNNVFLLRDTSGDTTDTIAGKISADSLTSMPGASTSPTNYLLIEGGLDTGFTTTPVGTLGNRQTYLVNEGLVDREVFVFFDSRFINGVLFNTSDSTFNNSGTSNTFNGSINVSQRGLLTSIGNGITNYKSVRGRTIANEVYQPTSGTNTEQDISVIGGPRSIAVALTPQIKGALDAEYTQYGTTGADGATIGLTTGTNYDFIDTAIYIQGATTLMSIQLPIRIIRLA
mgnify:CR=1 FL=1|tara:strand:- start:1919 stop:2929 length:1011 start_codon:yes stop_codon:yes gene_type:complete